MFAALTELGDELAAVDGIRSASPDPARVHTPGVWIELDGVQADATGWSLNVTLHLIVSDNGYARAAESLTTLLGLVLPVVEHDPDDLIVPQAVVLPSSPTKALPGLAFPIVLHVPGEAS